jgi:hypothetical protein
VCNLAVDDGEIAATGEELHDFGTLAGELRRRTLKEETGCCEEMIEAKLERLVEATPHAVSWVMQCPLIYSRSYLGLIHGAGARGHLRSAQPVDLI